MHGEEKDDFSSPSKPAATLTLAAPLLQRKSYPNHPCTSAPMNT